MSGHTKGPWRAIVAGPATEYTPAIPWDGKITQHVGIAGPNGEDVLNGCGECGSPWCENPADLRLIAAAPDLLAACEAAECELERLKDIVCEEDDESISETLYAIANAMLRARGGDHA